MTEINSLIWLRLETNKLFHSSAKSCEGIDFTLVSKNASLAVHCALGGQDDDAYNMRFMF